jgi:diguanylate cyclase (GGDEF)-like protein/PAS domain S-box-containing protein
LGSDRCFSGVNDALCRFLGRERSALVGHNPLEFTHPDDVPATERLAELSWPTIPTPRRSDSGPIEKRYLLPDGSLVWGLLHVAPLNTDDEPDIVIAQIEDITERKRAEERLVRQAHFDALTALPNRAQSMQRLASALATDAHNGTMTAVFFCDLDRLKLVNDGHGHAVGDAYICEVSRRIRVSVRDSDIVGRLSGDEFVVILEGLQTPTEAIGLAGRIIEAVRQPLQLGGVSFTPSLSLGIAYSGGVETTADELLAQADTAMYRAKIEDRGGWHVYDATMSNSAAAQLRLRSDVADALEGQQFVLHYQPIVRLADGSVAAHEALLRWQHPRRGLLQPAEFLDVILDSEFESPVTDWLIRQACTDAMQRPVGLRKVSVNMSSLQIGRRDLPAFIASCLAESGLQPANLVLELTEDRLLSRTDGAERLAALRDLGVVLAIDDFGTGYAGLGYLQRFPTLDVVKLDRSFVAGLGRDPVSEHIVRSMVELARGCGLALVTEGVETAHQAALLHELGVQYAQGYLFGRPAPLAPGVTQAAVAG